MDTYTQNICTHIFHLTSNKEVCHVRENLYARVASLSESAQQPAALLTPAVIVCFAGFAETWALEVI